MRIHSLVNRVFLLALLLTVGSCVVPYNPETEHLGSLLVVDGLVTDQPRSSYVLLTRTADYTASSLNLVVRQATVTVSDNMGQSVVFREISPGYYQPPTDWKGVSGRIYTLTIRTSDGNQYRSEPDMLKPVPSIDTVYYEYTRIPIPGTAVFDKGFDVYLDTQDPESPDDNYRWNWTAYEQISLCEIRESTDRSGVTTRTPFNCCTDCWDIGRCYACVTIATDNAVNGNKISRQPILRVGFTSTSRYYVEIEQYSLTDAAYQYWKTVRDLTRNTGGIFDSAPVTISGNIRSVTSPDERVFGFFGASGVSVRPVYVDRSKTGDQPDLLPPPPLPPPGPPLPCVRCIESNYRTAQKPRFWRN